MKGMKLYNRSTIYNLALKTFGPEAQALKLMEEAAELAEAAGKDAVIWEAADVLYFTLVAMARGGVTLADVAAELDRRALRLTRRAGDAKTKEGK